MAKSRSFGKSKSGKGKKGAAPKPTAPAPESSKSGKTLEAIEALADSISAIDSAVRTVADDLDALCNHLGLPKTEGTASASDDDDDDDEDAEDEDEDEDDDEDQDEDDED